MKVDHVNNGHTPQRPTQASKAVTTTASTTNTNNITNNRNITNITINNTVTSESSRCHKHRHLPSFIDMLAQPGFAKTWSAGRIIDLMA